MDLTPTILNRNNKEKCIFIQEGYIFNDVVYIYWRIKGYNVRFKYTI